MGRSFCLVLTLAVVGASPAPLSAATGGQLHKLLATDGRAGQSLGRSVAISGQIGIVGANDDNDFGQSSGAAYLFDVSTGTQLAKLTPSDAGADIQFGLSVGVSDSTAIVGAWFQDTEIALNTYTQTGAAYLFDVPSGTQRVRLMPSDISFGDQFGRSVAVSSNFAVVGTWLDAAPRVNQGSVYVFDVATGAQRFKLTANDGDAGDRFGASVDISGNIIIVGAPEEEVAGFDSNSGSAYLFDAITGAQIAKLTASDRAANDYFGNSVAIHGDRAIVGAFGDDDQGPGSDAAYLFDIPSGQQIAKLTRIAGDSGYDLGLAVDISEDYAIVGAYRDLEQGVMSGAAYLYDARTGTRVARWTADDASDGMAFGISVGISGPTAIIGAERDASLGARHGSAYVFSPVPEPGFGAFAAAGLSAGATRLRRRGAFAKAY